MKPIRLQVQMPVIGMFSIGGRSGVGEVEQLVETTVTGLRRSEHNGVLIEGSAMALAFVPAEFRRYLREKRRLVGDEHAWLAVKLADNKKSLAPFMASGDREWKEEEGGVSAINIDTSRTNTSTHRASLGADEIQRLLGDAVCGQLRLDAREAYVAVSVTLNSRLTCDGQDFDALVTVTVDHDRAPKVAGSA